MPLSENRPTLYTAGGVYNVNGKPLFALVTPVNGLPIVTTRAFNVPYPGHHSRMYRIEEEAEGNLVLHLSDERPLKDLGAPTAVTLKPGEPLHAKLREAIQSFTGVEVPLPAQI